MIWHGSDNPLSLVPDSVSHLFGLVLNPMTDRAEATRLVAVANYRSEIVDLIRIEKVEPYRDEDRWQKVFRKGGPLEWFNPPYGPLDGAADHWGIGIIELRRDGWRRSA